MMKSKSVHALAHGRDHNRFPAHRPRRGRRLTARACAARLAAMLDALLLALAAAQSAPAPAAAAAPDVIDDTFHACAAPRAPSTQAHSLVASNRAAVATIFLAIACVRGRRPGHAASWSSCRRTIGFDVAGRNSGGFSAPMPASTGRRSGWSARFRRRRRRPRSRARDSGPAAVLTQAQGHALARTLRDRGAQGGGEQRGHLSIIPIRPR